MLTRLFFLFTVIAVSLLVINASPVDVGKRTPVTSGPSSIKKPPTGGNGAGEKPSSGDRKPGGDAKAGGSRTPPGSPSNRPKSSLSGSSSSRHTPLKRTQIPIKKRPKGHARREEWARDLDGMLQPGSELTKRVPSRLWWDPNGDNYFLGPVTVGEHNPPQQFLLGLDTGSIITWIVHHPGTGATPHNAMTHQNSYTPPVGTQGDQTNPVVYPGEDEHAHGLEYFDTIMLPGEEQLQGPIMAASDLSNGLALAEFQPDGIFALGKKSFYIEEGQITTFAIQIHANPAPDGSVGLLTINGEIPANVEMHAADEITWTAHIPFTFVTTTVGAQNIEVGQQHALKNSESGMGSLFDSGTSVLDVDQATFTQITNAIPGYGPNNHTAPCQKTFDINMFFDRRTPGQPSATILGNNLLGQETPPASGRCQLLIEHSGRPNTWIFGAPFFIEKTVYFSKQRGIGFTPP